MVLSAIRQASNDLRTVNSFDSKRKYFKNGKKKSWAKNIDELYARRKKMKIGSTLDSFKDVFDSDRWHASFYESLGNVIGKVSPETGKLIHYYGESLKNKHGFVRHYPGIGLAIGIAANLADGDSLKVASEKAVADDTANSVVEVAFDGLVDGMIDVPIGVTDEAAGLVSDPFDGGTGTIIGSAAAITMMYKADVLIDGEINKVIEGNNK
ncbi:hypothetical protein [Ligilactobacillus sp. LYQ60]|uniref:hypothetical protein n=1 Tax=Ligilactobacillus sp. LYQ60 TaxID=3378799 RepID=UPI0038620D21